MDLVMDQLEGIGSSLSIPTKDGRVMSLGDALGKTIRKYWNAKRQVGLKAILLGEVDFDTLLPHTNGHTNGHTGHGSALMPIHGTEMAGIAAAISAHTPNPIQGVLKPSSGTTMMNNYKIKCPEEHCAGTLAFMEGCMKCVSCGFSKC